jgi:hypothetical protein
VLGPRHPHLAARETQDGAAGPEQDPRRLLVRIHEVDAPEVGERMEVVRVSGGAVQRLVPEGLQERDERGLRARLGREVEVEGGAGQAVRVETERANRRVAEARPVEERREDAQDAAEVQETDPPRPPYATAPASGGRGRPRARKRPAPAGSSSRPWFRSTRPRSTDIHGRPLAFHPS